MLAKTALIAAISLGLAGANFAPASYNMKDPKDVSGLTFAIDSPLEPIYGYSKAVSGDIQFDPAHPEKTTGKIVVQTKEVATVSPALTDAMLGDWCLNPEKYPTIEFEIKKIDTVKETSKGVFEADVTGNFTLNGTTKEIQVKATATHLPGALSARGGVPGKQGDLVIIRTKFNFNRLDYGVAKDLDMMKIGTKVNIDLSAVGYTTT